MANPSVIRDEVFMQALLKQQRATEELWQVTDERMSSLREVGVEHSDDPICACIPAREAISSVLDVYNALLSEQRAFHSRMDDFYGELMHHCNRIDALAMNIGVSRIPNELLENIFFYASDDLKSTIALSHVCKKFRSVAVGSPPLWQRFELSPTWRHELIRMVGERGALLKAQLDEVVVDSVAAILSLGSKLESLTIDLDYDSPYTPPERNTLTEEIESHEFPCLKSLVWRCPQCIGSPVRPRRLLESPSLRALDVDFIPELSRAGSLVYIYLDLESEASLEPLMNFLSSLTMTEDLSISLGRDQEGLEKPETITLPKLEIFRLSVGLHGVRNAKVLIRQIHSDCLRTLDLDCQDMLSKDATEELIRSKPSVKELGISGYLCDGLDLSRIPQQIEILTLKGGPGDVFIPTLSCSESLESHHIRLVRLIRFNYDERVKVLRARDAFTAFGRNDIQFEFRGFSGFTNGTFRIDEIDSAVVEFDYDYDYDYSSDSD